MINTVKINTQTKKAWVDNWETIKIEQILEIFSYPRVQKQLKIFLKYLPKNDLILEGGCGLGPYLIHLNDMQYKIFGVDYNREPLMRIKNFNQNLQLCNMDVKNLFFKDSSFGGYLSLGVIEHFTEGPEKAIQEAKRVLKTNGIFIVTVPLMNLFLFLRSPIDMVKKTNLIRKIFKKTEKNYYWQQYFKPKNLKNIILSNGFKILKMMPIDHEYGLISFSSIFRDKESYDGANKFAINLSKFCEKYLPWLTAGSMILICKKI